jgi:hypothetical protein
MNNFIDNDENVLRIYEHIVNYLESFPSAIKQTKIADMQNFYDNQNTIFNVDFDRLIKHEETRIQIRTLFTIIVILHPELRGYRNDIISMDFNKYFLQHAFDVLNDIPLK